MKSNVTRTRETVNDIERSMTILSDTDRLSMINTQQRTESKDTLNENTKSVDSAPDADDPEITFAKFVSTNKTSGTTDSTTSENPENGTGRKSNDQKNRKSDSSIRDRNQENRDTQNKPSEYAKNEEMKDSYRKPLVCLIGDSISGQVAASYLGKTTNTYVKKLRAPKVEDIGKYTSEVKGAKIVVINSGINNLREKESTSTITSTLKKSILDLQEAAPDAKFLLSKVTPVGERALEIERNMLNAGTEKIFTESAVDNISYIDHGNLADRGSIIKELYRPDELHLSQDGVYKFTGNLKDAILDALLGKRESVRNDAKRQNSEYETDRNRSQNINTDRYQRDYIRENDRYIPREQRQRGYVRARNAEYYENERPWLL